MSPARWDVLGVTALFAAPLAVMYLKGTLTLDDLTARLPWCLLAGWVVVAVLRAASRPPAAPHRSAVPHATEGEDTPTS
jgi:hypothetical protein